MAAWILMVTVLWAGKPYQFQAVLRIYDNPTTCQTAANNLHAMTNKNPFMSERFICLRGDR